MTLNDPFFFWLSVTLIVAYALLWWITSIEPVSRREKLKAALRPFYADTGEAIGSLKRVKTDEEFESLIEAIDAEQQGIVDWLSAHMGQAAVRKFLTVHGGSYSYEWVGTHAPPLVRKRDDYLDALYGRLANLQQLLESDGWDGPHKAGWKRFWAKGGDR